MESSVTTDIPDMGTPGKGSSAAIVWRGGVDGPWMEKDLAHGADIDGLVDGAMSIAHLVREERQRDERVYGQEWTIRDSACGFLPLLLIFRLAIGAFCCPQPMS